MSSPKILILQNISITEPVHITLKSTDKTTTYIDKFIIKPKSVHEVSSELLGLSGTKYLELYSTNDEIWWSGYIQSCTSQPIIIDIEHHKILYSGRPLINIHQSNVFSPLSPSLIFMVALIILLIVYFYYSYKVK